MRFQVRNAVVLGSLFYCCTAGLHSQWRGNNAHHGFYPHAKIENVVEFQWKFRTDGAVRSTPAVLHTSIIIGSSDTYLYSLNKTNGSLRWKFKALGSISSSPIVDGSVVYVVDRKNILYAVDIVKGKEKWKKRLGSPLPYEWGFDYYVGSPAVEHNIIYVGSADGKMYAVSTDKGKILWSYDASSVIRSTPALDNDAVYFGSSAGKIYSLDKMNGTLRWTYATIGDTLDNVKFGFDRKAVISSPTLAGNTVVVGGRDGFLYALDKSSGKELWKSNYNVSWVISTAAVHGNRLVTATSDGRYVNALNINDGKEIWRFTTNGPVWASPSIAGNNTVIIPGNDGNIYALSLDDGSEIWRYRIGPQIFSSAVPEENMMYFGSDDMCVYALSTYHTERKPLSAVKRAVFWMKDPLYQSFRSGMDLAMRDYFIKEGYQFYDDSDVKDFLLARIHSDTASVLVFATNYFIPAITKDTLGSNLLREYLRTGGKIVIMGMNPSAYRIDYENKQVTAIDFSLSENITGVQYRYDDLRSHGGFYSSTVTAEGKRWGLITNFVGIAGMPLTDIDIPLAVDENGNATAWVKQFNNRAGSGFVQLFITPDRLDELPQVQKVAEYGLR